MLMDIVKSVLPQIIDLRHTLHRVPEIMFGEHKTREILLEEFHGLELKFLPAYLETGIVALIEGEHPGNNVTLRADMDALPIEDLSGAQWQSQNNGFSHACGHDGHMAILVGALRVLDQLRDRIHGSVRFVFQPAEEGKGGGKLMVEKGLMDQKPVPSAVFALHGWPELPVGKIAALPGPMMAAADTFDVVIKGKGGHGAKPHLTRDPIVTGAQVIQAFQTVSSRVVNPLDAVVVSVCSVQGGSTVNIIPDTVTLKGTTRYFKAELRDKVREAMKRIIRGICTASGTDYEFHYHEGYIPLINDADMVRSARNIVKSNLGESVWVEEIEPSMVAEDFAYFVEKVPGVCFLLGVGNNSHGLHTSQYDFNDEAIENGILLFSSLCLEILGQP
jgi:amidohydrolase